MGEARPADLDEELVRGFLSQVRRSRAALAHRSDEDLLRRFRVLVRHGESADSFVPSLAGLLAFGRDPQEFPALRGCSVTVTTYPTVRKSEAGPAGERFLDDKVLEGPLPVLLEDVLSVDPLRWKLRPISPRTACHGRAVQFGVVGSPRAGCTARRWIIKSRRSKRRALLGGFDGNADGNGSRRPRTTTDVGRPPSRHGGRPGTTAD